MDNKTYYNEILTDHNIRPLHKNTKGEFNLELQGVNPSCGDEIVLKLKEENGIITDGTFEGSGCAISQASCDIMMDLVIGKPSSEALRLSDIFMRMIKGEASEEEIEELEEGEALKDISHLPARVKCAVLGWHTLEELFKKNS